jgi:hypothetical protein
MSSDQSPSEVRAALREQLAEQAAAIRVWREKEYFDLDTASRLIYAAEPLLRAAAEALSESPASSGTGGWQPIETAPKDGSVIVTMHPKWAGVQAATWTLRGIWVTVPGRYTVRPTLWMATPPLPLILPSPLPPQEQERDPTS